jgi:hypothetical protein
MILYYCRYCGVQNPSWSELTHFVFFLNKQLQDFQKSVYCDTKAMGQDLPEFSVFVLRFLIQMSRVRKSSLFFGWASFRWDQGPSCAFICDIGLIVHMVWKHSETSICRIISQVHWLFCESWKCVLPLTPNPSCFPCTTTNTHLFYFWSVTIILTTILNC